MNDGFTNPGDPLQRSQRRTRRTQLAMGAGVIAASVWALLPARSGEWTPPVLEPAAQVPEQSMARMDRGAYDVVLWTPPSEKPVQVAVAPPPPPPPLKLQLIGIHAEQQADGSELVRATLYDPQTDQLIIVNNGDKVGRYTVRSMTRTEIALDDGQRTRTLSTVAGGKPPS